MSLGIARGAHVTPLALEPTRTHLINALMGTVVVSVACAAWVAIDAELTEVREALPLVAVVVVVGVAHVFGVTRRARLADCLIRARLLVGVAFAAELCLAVLVFITGVFKLAFRAVAVLMADA